MTLRDIKSVLAAVDPSIRFGWSMGTGADYSYWEPTGRLPLTADDRHVEEGWTFVVHRFTRREDDPVAPALFSALDQNPNIAVSWQITPDPGTEYIHHIMDCEAV